MAMTDARKMNRRNIQSPPLPRDATICLAGVDEAGRGPLAGPVLAAAVVLDPACEIPGLNDSKKLSAKKRESLYAEIIEKSLSYGVGRAEVEEIDRLNILQASLLAMKRAVLALSIEPEEVWVDGLYCPSINYTCYALVQGDSKMAAISAASIIAKVLRDREMEALAVDYPEYGFAKHKGYPTAAHRAALIEFGASAVHRRSFAPVKEAIAQYRQTERDTI